MKVKDVQNLIDFYIHYAQKSNIFFVKNLTYKDPYSNHYLILVRVENFRILLDNLKDINSCLYLF